MSKPRRRLKRILIVLGALLLLWLLSSVAVAYWLTRRPHALADEPAPALAWGKVEPLRLTASDGEQLGAWFIDGHPDLPLVILLHGYGACRGACLPQAEIVASLGHPVLLVRLRAHGDSTGDFNDFGYSARHDVVAAVTWAGRRLPGRRVLVWGQSIGSAAAVFAGAELGERVSGYILECPYRDLHTAVWNRTRHYLPPVLDVAAYLGLATAAPLFIPDADAISPLNAAATLPRGVPVLALAGGADRRARPEEARAICDAIGPSAELVVIGGADHSKLLEADPAGYGRTVSAFLARASK